MKVSLPQPGSWRQLGVAVGLSLVVHLGLFALLLVWAHLAPPVVLKKGEPIFVELPKPEEPAPRGNPALSPGPPAPAARPPAPKSPPPTPKPAPKAQVARPAPKVEPAPAPKPAAPPSPPQVAKAAPEPEPEGTKPAPVAPREEAKPAPAAPPAGAPKVTLSKPAIDLPPGLQAGIPGGGGGLRGGRGGVEGEPVPLDTTDPRYTDYFEKIRLKIRENWIYPREAGERGIGGQLMIDFAIRKDGWLQVVELRRSSGVAVLDQYALNALKLAQPFPPVPDSVSKGSLPIAGIFTYVIVDSGLMNQFLR